MSVQGEMTVCADRLVLFSYASALIAVEIKSQAIAEHGAGEFRAGLERG